MLNTVVSKPSFSRTSAEERGNSTSEESTMENRFRHDELENLDEQMTKLSEIIRQFSFRELNSPPNDTSTLVGETVASDSETENGFEVLESVKYGCETIKRQKVRTPRKSNHTPKQVKLHRKDKEVEEKRRRQVNKSSKQDANFLTEDKEILGNKRARILTIRIAIARALGIRVDCKLTLFMDDGVKMLPNSVSGGKLNVKVFCMIGKLKHGCESKPKWYCPKRIYGNIGGPNIWAKRNWNISDSKWRILGEYSRMKYDEKVMTIVREVSPHTSGANMRT